MSSSKKIIFISISVALYVIALFLPSYRDNINYYGWECIPNGIFTIEKLDSNPFMFISWISNLPFYTGLIILLCSEKKKGFAVGRVFLMISFIMSLGVISRYYCMLPGSVFWIASQFILFFGAVVLKKEFSEEKT
ncbi:MAG: hypothetical protein IAF38_21640 [Bacteroidia bacterium]|nr:hypothetical protein [Bacteroidia bacterium]